MLAIHLILNVKRNIDFLSCNELIDLLAYVSEESQHDSLNPIDLLKLLQTDFLHLDEVALIFDHLADGHLVTFFLLVEVFLDIIESIYQVVAKIFDLFNARILIT